MDSAGIGATKVVATGFGEDFICDDGTVTFHAMETDFRVVYRQDDPEDLDAVGARIAAILAVLEEFPPDRTPGPAGGYIDLVVNPESGGGLSFRVAFSRAMELHMEGLEGAALTGALGYQPAP